MDMRVSLLLQPLPGRGRDDISASSSAAPHGQQTAKQQNRAANQVARIQQMQATIAGMKRKDGGKGGKGRGKGGKHNRQQHWQLPHVFLGKTVRLPTGTQLGTPGDAISFNFNFGFCCGGVPSQRCDKGWHVCAKPGCQQVHGMTNHR